MEDNNKPEYWYDIRGLPCEKGKSFTGKDMKECFSCHKLVSVSKKGILFRHNRGWNRGDKCDGCGRHYKGDQ